MIEPSLQIGGGNWANKSDSLLGYHKDGANFYADELTFSRNSLGSYTDANGLIQSMPYNLLTYSEQFDNAAWTKYIGSVTANATTSPSGLQNADKFIDSTDNEVHALYKAYTISGDTTFSIYVKSAEYSKIAFTNLSDGGTAKFDISNGTIISTSAQWKNSTIQNVGNGWYRIASTTNGISGSKAIGTSLLNSSNQEVFVGTGTSGIFLWGAQVNQGSTAKPYFATTTRLNLARVDYKDNVNGSLLLESQRTNFALYSEQLDNAYWLKYQCSITANQAISPDGTQNADLFTATASGDNVIYRGGFATRVLSFFVKAGTLSASTKFYIAVDGVGNAKWNQDGTINSQTGGTATNGVSYGNGWYRFTFIVGGGSVANFGLSNSTSGDTLFIYGIQAEEGTYVSSYIKSEGAATTRLADSCSKTGISDKIGQTEGVVFMDFTVDTISAQTSDPVLWYMKDGGAGERYVELYSNGNLVYLESNGSTIANITKTGLAVGRHKCAIAYKNNDMVFYVDGVLIGTDVSGTPSGFSTFGLQYYISTYTGQQKVNQALLFKTRLTNAELATLTTL
jgi:hypothetical protein